MFFTHNYTQKIDKWICLFLSFFILSLAQVDLSLWACVMAASCGFSLFWYGLKAFTTSKNRFIAAFVSFATISFCHLSWFTADKYVGTAIYIFLFIWVLFLGLLWAFFCALLGKSSLSFRALLGLAGLWTLSEWSKLYILSGYTLDPVGLTLTASTASLQMASVGGVYALSFWVVFTNLVCYRFFCSRKIITLIIWLVCASTPYLGGMWLLSFHRHSMHDYDKKLSVALVQPALAPDEKMPIDPKKTPLTPLEQVYHLLTLLKPLQGSGVELIVLPEAALPFAATNEIYLKSEIKTLFHKVLGMQDVPLPNKQWLTNLDFSQAVADYFSSDLIVGLEEEGEKNYNAAFFVRPHVKEYVRYDKRLLVPFGEYIPFACAKGWLKKHYGIQDCFSAGQEAIIFPSKVKIATSICYEETQGSLMREAILKGAQVLVNLTNDGWYPRSRLPQVHFAHARLRAVELGRPLWRSCNTGVTVALNSLGEVEAMIKPETSQQEAEAALLPMMASLYHYETLYARWGNSLIIGLSIIALSGWALFSRPTLRIKWRGMNSMKKN